MFGIPCHAPPSSCLIITWLHTYSIDALRSPPTTYLRLLVFTADDAIQSYTLDSVNQFLAHRKNPNGCTPKMTYFTSLNYTNYTLVTDWFVAGNEIADHTCVSPVFLVYYIR